MQKAILKLAIPLIISNITVPLLGLINTIMTGHLGQDYYLGAVSLGAMIFNFIFWGFGCIRMSLTGVIAQAYGDTNIDRINQFISHGLIFSFFAGLLLIILQKPIITGAFWFIDTNNNINFYTHQYYFIRIWAAPAAMINFALMGIFIGMQNSKLPLLIVTITNVLATLLGLFFVLKLQLNIQGIALADVIGQYTGMFSGLCLLLLHLKKKNTNTKKNKNKNNLIYKLPRFKFDKSISKLLFSANSNVFIRSLCLLITFSAFTLYSAKLGGLVLAANTILLNLIMMTAYAQDGFANAAEALVGKYMGAKNKANIMLAIKNTTLWSVLIGIGFTLIFLAFGKLFIHLITDIQEVREMARAYLNYLIIAPLITLWCFELDGIFIGANQFKAMRNTMIISMLGFFVIKLLLNNYNNTGLWLAFLSYFLLRAATMGWVLIKNNYFIPKLISKTGI